jgi:hypothetical protein
MLIDGSFFFEGNMMNFRHDEWIEFHRVIKRQNEIDSNEEEIIEENKQGKHRKIEGNKTILNDQDNGSNLYKI